MEGFDLPMSFGKKSKAGNSNLKAKVENTKRADIFTSVKGEEPAKEVPRPPLSTTGRKADAEEDDNEEEIGPIPPSATGKRKAEESDVSDDEQEAEEEVDRLPISHEIILKDHTKVCGFMARV